MRNAVADMKEILEGGDPKSAAFLRSELKKLPVFAQEKDGTAAIRRAKGQRFRGDGSESAEHCSIRTARGDRRRWCRVGRSFSGT